MNAVKILMPNRQRMYIIAETSRRSYIKLMP
jgi:hypothetical protein